MPITVTEPGDGGTLVTVPEPVEGAAPPETPAGTPGDSAPPSSDAPAAPAPEEPAPPASAPDVSHSVPATTEEDDDEAPEPVPRGVQRKIDREVRRRHEAERKAAAIEARLQMLEQGYQRAPQTPEPVPLHQQPEPREEDYPSQQEWFTAVRAWDKAQLKQELARESHAQRQQEQQRAQQARLVEQAQAARQKYADFDAVLDRLSGVYSAPALDACVQESDLGAELTYYLAQHPEEIQRLNQVAQTAPLAMAREIGKLEMRLSSPTNGASRPTPPTPKPAPPTPLSGVGSPGPRTLYDMTDEEINAMSQKEYDAIYQRMYPGSR